MKAAIIGHPVSHSKSPLIHSYWMAQHGVTGRYDAIDIPPGDLERALGDLVAQGYDGFNVTVPHKIDVMALCDDLDHDARAIGAVNTLVVVDGRLHGKNTDAFGFIENLKAHMPDHQFARPAMVLGAGGAARAVVQALLSAGTPQIYLANRSREKAGQLRAMAPDQIEIVDWRARPCGLLVNTTSLGMTGQPALDIDLSDLPENAAVYDIVYAPLMTGLLHAAQARGNPIVTGIGMLLHQARAAFAAWTGIMPDVDAALEARVLA